MINVILSAFNKSPLARAIETRKEAFKKAAFIRTMKAGKAAYLAGDNAKALAYCGKLLAMANRANNKELKSRVMGVMNKVRAAQRRAAKSGQYAPVMIVRAKSHTFAGNALIAGAAMAFVACTVSIGMLIPMGEPSIFNLVQYHGEESDIVDYDLSAMDCGFYLSQSRATGGDTFCEVASK